MSLTPSSFSTRMTRLFSSLVRGPGATRSARRASSAASDSGSPGWRSFGSADDRALFIEQDELKLLHRHLPELGKGQLSVRLSRVANDLQHAKAALVSRAVGPAGVDQRAKRAFVRAACLIPVIERVPELGCSSLPAEIALNVTRNHVRFGHEADRSLDERRSIDVEERRFRHCVANLALSTRDRS